MEYDIPPAPAELRDLVKRFEVLFSTVPGSTTVAHHTIPTADHPPVRVPPRRVPVSGYWQLPVKEEDCIKTAFCPGPGMGLYEFCRMPFGVTGGPSSFHRLMDKVLHGLAFATSYIDDVLVHSPNMKCHLQHLQQVFERLANAGPALRGSKCQLGLDKLHYLGYVFSEAGMSPDKENSCYQGLADS